jgi:hypothetical protein
MSGRRQLRSERFRLRVPRLTNGLYRTTTSTRRKQRKRHKQPSRRMPRRKIRPSQFRRKALQWLARMQVVTTVQRRTYRQSSRLRTGRSDSNVPISRNKITTSSTRLGDGSLRDSPLEELFRCWSDVPVQADMTGARVAHAVRGDTIQTLTLHFPS